MERIARKLKTNFRAMAQRSPSNSQENASRAAIERIRSKPAPNEATVDRWAEAIVGGDNRVLAQGISLVESERPADRQAAEQLLNLLLPHAGKAVRVGITGVPGAGKSTLIEAAGLRWIERGHRVAVLAIDPSSRRTGGSVLGDKTRMERLAQAPEAFIRPSPAGATLGGVARATGEAIVLFEAAGFDRIIVETVGVGQSETEVRSLTDFFVLMLISGAGDELQGIKRGVLEFADILLVNKADGDNIERAKQAATRYERALEMLPPPPAGEPCKVQAISALERRGIDGLLETLMIREALLRKSGRFDALRADQRTAFLQHLLREQALRSIREQHGFEGAWAAAEQSVREGRSTPYSALRSFFKPDAEKPSAEKPS
jgi:LAO/AO transport system kinase